MILTRKLDANASSQERYRECPVCHMKIERSADHLPGCSRPKTKLVAYGLEAETNRECFARMVEDLRRRGVNALLVEKSGKAWIERRN